jgi:cell division GTPase FtsZ
MVTHSPGGKNPNYDLYQKNVLRNKIKREFEEKQSKNKKMGRSGGLKLEKYRREQKQEPAQADTKLEPNQDKQPVQEQPIRKAPRPRPKPKPVIKEEPKTEVKPVALNHEPKIEILGEPKAEPKPEPVPEPPKPVVPEPVVEESKPEPVINIEPEPEPVSAAPTLAMKNIERIRKLQKDLIDKKEKKMEVAIKYGFLGIGQGGSRLAEAFHKLGYAACAINTSPQDLDAIDIDNKLAFGDGGAGKNIASGKKQAQEAKSKIENAIRLAFIDEVDYIIICIGMSGGTGAGAWSVALECLEGCGFKNKIGVIGTLPTKKEDTTAKKNALQSLEDLFSLALSKKISPFIIADNAKIQEKFPNMGIMDFWQKANEEITSVFHLINLMSVQNGKYGGALDKKDYTNIIRSGGCMIYGSADIDTSSNSAISSSVASQTEDGLLADGFSLTDSNCAGVVIIGDDNSLRGFSMENQEHILDLVRKIIGAGTVYHGTYALPNAPSVKMLSVYGGLGLPVSRVKKLIEETKQQVDIVQEKEINKTSVADIMAQLNSEESTEDE